MFELSLQFEKIGVDVKDKEWTLPGNRPDVVIHVAMLLTSRCQLLRHIH